ncbi:hypothetical protein F2Q68_00005673 [Brassica cretica]|uniref:Phenylalanyl-tRNA synthetase domain-containing protein n=1 Tax=Brassica cretica TaxID=69181 RepID=A0A8S9JKI2_BRACR|nr:hypothetical protein F2Q68_00005673 [Brassica cretica]
MLLQIQQGLELDKESLQSLKTRQLIISTKAWTGYSDVKKGPNYAPKRKSLPTDLTRENLQNWEELEFKEYNFNAKGQPLDAGHHLKAVDRTHLAEFHQIEGLVCDRGHTLDPRCYSNGSSTGCSSHCMGSLSLERPTMILYEIDNIRHLFGHKVNLTKIKQNRLCRTGIESA